MRKDLEDAVDAAAYQLRLRLEALVDSLPDRGATAPDLGYVGRRRAAEVLLCPICGAATSAHTLDGRHPAPLDRAPHRTVK